jgi:hypothetical protein
MIPFYDVNELQLMMLQAAGDFGYIVEEHNIMATTLGYFETRNIGASHFRIINVKSIYFVNADRYKFGIPELKPQLKLRFFQ